jgi:hypothetical protein
MNVPLFFLGIYMVSLGLTALMKRYRLGPFEFLGTFVVVEFYFLHFTLGATP